MTVFPDGSKERLHGHNFQVSVAFHLRRVDFNSLLDFGKIKDILVAQCLDWDQRLILARRNPHFEILSSDAQGTEFEFRLCGLRYVVPLNEVLLLEVDNIIVETLSTSFGKILIRRLKPLMKADVVAGVEVTVTESAGQGASFYWQWADPLED